MRHIAATFTAVLVTVALTPAPAGAALVTHCIGTGGAVTVPNDLYVPAGESCDLTGTVITGNVSVAAGANLVIDGGRVDGDVRVAADGYLDASGSTVGGAVVLAAGGYGLYLRDASTGPVTVRPKGTATVDSFLFAEATTITGSVNSQAGEVRLDRGSEITGGVSTTGTYYTDVHDSFIDGVLSVLNSSTGSVVCGSAVRGRSTFAGNLGGVQLGPNGGLDSCASGGYFGRDVSITNTTGGVSVEDTIIDGTLTVNSNNPAARIGTDNRIRGGVISTQAAGTAGLASAQRRATAAARDGDAAAERTEERRAEAVQEATAAGQADL
ncbi:hypothetical protein Q0Z83_017370 [Actinoplanes sichuanensis]|uniref:Uncharacterized protein n=1 Tax=Actinoplanes sichuanensis TaxID=512349 RepID=A0ABW4A7B2_9ACTN|nr:hypothetical protein [Actinoplanes sichuanensis]BEL03546.1 hypothetical protein Q0Z83_017370 [Actinoplanes sichuanensis]